MTLNGLYTLAANDGIEILPFGFSTQEALSIMDSDGRCYIGIDPCKLTSIIDEKMKLAHELGHCETGAFYNVYSPYDIRQRCENRADKWAIKKLIPEDELDAAMAAGYTEPWELAEVLDVSEPFIRKALNWYSHGNLYSA